MSSAYVSKSDMGCSFFRLIGQPACRNHGTKANAAAAHAMLGQPQETNGMIGVKQ